MRTSITLEADVYRFASAYAGAKGITLSAAISELVRRAEQMAESPVSTSTRLKTSSRGYLVRAKTGTVITPDMVKEATEDDLG
jgi:macrodomain Ter protein organizer (MatP/YcbG family)